MIEPTEAEEVGAGVLDALRGFYPVADDMPDAYHMGAALARQYKEHYFTVYGVEDENGHIVWDIDPEAANTMHGSLWNPNDESWGYPEADDDIKRDTRLAADLWRRLSD
jgi:hypothetical protein